MKIKLITDLESSEPLSDEVNRLKSNFGIQENIQVLTMEEFDNQISGKFLFVLEDVARDFLPIVRAAIRTNLFNEVLVADRIPVIKSLITKLKIAPVLVTLDFHIGDINSFYKDTSEIYGLLKLKFPTTEIMGYTNYENAGEDETGNQARKLIQLFVEHDENVYDKFSFQGKGTLENIFRDKMRLMRSDQKQKDIEIENAKLREDTILTDAELPISSGKEYLVGNSRAMRLLYRDLHGLKGVEAKVLILGETGTGKDLVAQVICEDSPRGKSSVCQYLEINCGEFSKSDSNSVISKLFGHKKGAFTGAEQDKRGILEIAHNGTVFFDEVGNIPMEAQEKLLRYLSKGEFYRLGDDEKKFTSNVRLIFATNADPDELIRQGKLKDDFYNRIKTFKIIVPSLAERKEDIPILTKHIITDKEKLKKNFGNSDIKFTITQDAIEPLTTHHFLGNIRELEDILIRAMSYARTTNNQISRTHIAESLKVEDQNTVIIECDDTRSFLNKIEKIIEERFLDYPKVDIEDVVPFFTSTKTGKLGIARPYFSKYELIPRKKCIKKYLGEYPDEWPLIREKKINLLTAEKGK